jgi:hypothetical protein
VEKGAQKDTQSRQKDTQSRKWQITINNPLDKGYTHDSIKESVGTMRNVIYWCMCDEIGDEGTFHTHIYIQGKNGIRFSTIKARFQGGHFEIAKGTAQHNRDYLTKTGKWLDSHKHETSVQGTFEEFGDLPLERQGCRNDLADLCSMIQDGYTDYEILQHDPSYLLHLERFDKLRQVFQQEKNKNLWRDLTVTYIFGDTGSGKTRSVMEKYGYDNVYRVTDYLHPFDSYRGQDVMLFEEFRSSFRIGEMLNYLDGYPCDLRSRYNNKFACYTKVYILSNIPLAQQYSNVQIEEYGSYMAFLRRINRVLHFACGKIEESKVEFIGDGFRLLLQGEYNAFSDIEDGR